MNTLADKKTNQPILLPLMLFISLLISPLLVKFAQAETPWVYAEGEKTVSVSIVDDRFDQFWAGTTITPIASVIQQNIWLTYSRGLTNKLMLSAKIGYTKTSQMLGDTASEGLADSNFTLKYQLLNEFIDESIVSLSFTINGIVKGTYDRAANANMHAAGDKANGGEISLQLGKFVMDDFATYTDISYRKMTDNVPDDIKINIGTYYSINKLIGVNAQYSIKRALSGTDIGDQSTGFRIDSIHKTKEQKQWIELSIDYTFMPSNAVNVGWAKVLTGRNTGKSQMFFISYQYSL